MSALALAWMAAAGALFELYRPALRGEFLSDDVGYLTNNPWIQRLAWDDVVAIFDPWGGPASYSSNWAPVNLLLHALEWHVFGEHTFGYHAVNVSLHALVSVLLVAVFLRAGIPVLAAWLAAALFLLHPANVEAVAWISQLKTLASTVFALGALLAHPRRPALGAALFVLAVLTKATAFFVLPVAAYWAWIAHRSREAPPQRLGWIGVWGLLFLVYLAPQFTAFFRGNIEGATLHPDPWVHVRTMAAIGARYLAMAATGLGTAPFHQPAAALSPADPWWLAALALGAAIGARAFVTLRRGSVEGGFWIWAAFAYAPISQIFPFRYPMGDRYLYDVLPGLLGALLLAGRDALARLDAWKIARGGRPLSRPTVSRVGAAAALAVAAFFALRSHAQARIWSALLPLSEASAAAYPDGMNAHLLRARDAALAGDDTTAIAEIRAAADRGFDLFLGMPKEPTFAALRRHPEFQAIAFELAGRWIELARARGYESQPELIAWAQAHESRGEWAEAVERLERAVERGGPLDAVARERLAAARRKLAQQEEAAGRRSAAPASSGAPGPGTAP